MQIYAITKFNKTEFEKPIVQISIWKFGLGREPTDVENMEEAVRGAPQNQYMVEVNTWEEYGGLKTVFVISR